MSDNTEKREKKFYDTKSFYFFIGFAIGVLILVLFGYTVSKPEEGNNKSQITGPQDYRIVTPPMAKKISFAGEKVPLKNFEVKERLERELIVNTYFHSSTVLALKNAHRWFPIIEPILKKNHIPDDFKYLCLIESNLTNTISPVGATGFWQFTEATARKYGLEVNKYIDERYNVRKSTEAACKYFQKAHDEFKSWTLAAASYNFGIDGIAKQLVRQKADNYYNLVLGEETSRYLPRAIAMKEIFNNPEKYGYFLKSNKLYNQLDTYNIKVNSTINNLADFADKNGINYKILKYYNPWMHDTVLPDRSKKVYSILMPEKGSIYIIK